MPYPRAVAVVSWMMRRMLRFAMAAASMMARRWRSVYQPGTAMTISETSVLSSLEAMSRILPR